MHDQCINCSALQAENDALKRDLAEAQAAALEMAERLIAMARIADEETAAHQRWQDYALELEAERDTTVAELAAEIDQRDQDADTLKRELEAEKAVNAMHWRRITRLEATQGGRAADDGEEPRPLVTLDPGLLTYLVRETAATQTLRQRYSAVRAILADPVMKDGQKLTAMALAARLPVPCAETVRESAAAVLVKVKAGHSLR